MHSLLQKIDQFASQSQLLIQNAEEQKRGGTIKIKANKTREGNTIVD